MCPLILVAAVSEIDKLLLIRPHWFWESSVVFMRQTRFHVLEGLQRKESRFAGYRRRGLAHDLPNSSGEIRTDSCTIKVLSGVVDVLAIDSNSSEEDYKYISIFSGLQSRAIKSFTAQGFSRWVKYRSLMQRSLRQRLWQTWRDKTLPLNSTKILAMLCSIAPLDELVTSRATHLFNAVHNYVFNVEETGCKRSIPLEGTVRASSLAKRLGRVGCQPSRSHNRKGWA